MFNELDYYSQETTNFICSLHKYFLSTSKCQVLSQCRDTAVNVMGENPHLLSTMLDGGKCIENNDSGQGNRVG